jgi:uncharacterized protein (DUF2267 family)
MTHDEFTGQVQARARLGSRGAAEAAIRATLETLAERLEPGASENLSAQLPPEIARHLRGDHAITFERLSLDDFFRRVSDREGPGIDLPEAVYHARVVMEVLQEAVSPGEIEKIRRSLPPEFRPIFEAGSQGRMNVDREERGSHA